MAVQRDEQVELLDADIGEPSSWSPAGQPVAGIPAVAEAQRRGKIEIGPTACCTCRRSRHWRIKPSRFAPARPSTSFIGSVQFPDLLLEVDAATGYSESLLGHRAHSADEPRRLYGALLAHGTDADAKGVASMIPGLRAGAGHGGHACAGGRRTPASRQ